MIQMPIINKKNLFYIKRYSAARLHKFMNKKSFYYLLSYFSNKFLLNN